MIGVQLRTKYSDTRKFNSEILTERIRNTIGPWKGGRHMPIIERGHAINSNLLSKLWFRCASLNMREHDTTTILSNIKAWVYQDTLIKPSELALY